MSVLDRAFAAGAAVLTSAVEAGELPGAAFAVASADGGVRHVVAGLADVGAGRAVTVDTPFSLASTTKPIAATVLGALVDAGVLAWDEPVDLPRGLLPAGRPATLLEVAAHTAGLGTHHRFAYVDELTDERAAWSASDAVRSAVASFARPVLPPGWQWRYSNLGYGALQFVAEQASGTSMDELVQRHVFDAVGMPTAGWGSPTGPAGAAVRYGAELRPYPGYTTDHPCASEAWCGIDDLVRFGLAHATGSLLSGAAHGLIGSPVAPRQADGGAYGVGWVTRDVGRDGVRLLVHAGRMGGVGAHLAVVPSLGLAVAALANAETDRLGEAVATVLGAVIEGYAPSAPAPAPGWRGGPAHPSLRARWEGELLLGDDRSPAVLDASGDTITLEIDGENTPLVSPHLQPHLVAGHANLALRARLAPAGSILHLDALPARVVDGEFEPYRPDETGAIPDAIVGALVAARYASPDRPLQGDAVSAALLLHRVTA